MLTRCPYADCLYSFDLSSDRPVDLMRPERGKCPECGRPASFRALEILDKCDKQRMKYGDQITASVTHGEMFVLLEDVRSLWNVGSIFRTADGAGFSKVFLCGITGCPPRKEIAKTSLGAEEHMQWQYAGGAAHILQALKVQGCFIVGLEKTATSKDLKECLSQSEIKKPFCLVVGNEVTGLSEESLWLSDAICHLPMRGIKESLNVAVAFGVAAYELSGSL